MAGDELVSGEGWISDESDFYGDKEMREKLENKARKRRKRGYFDLFAHLNAKRVKLEAKPVAKPEPASSPAPEAKPAGSVLDFLKSRPQVSVMLQNHAKQTQSAKRETPRTLDSTAEDIVLNYCVNRDPATWQHDETINEFLKRAPVVNEATADLGPWLWVHSPTIRYHQKRAAQKMDLATFQEGGGELFAAFRKQRTKVEDANEGKPPGTITRLLRPYREQLEDDLLALAVKTGTTSGKWMLFPLPDDLPRYWRLVAEATAQGKLGSTCKVATPDGSGGEKGTLICVYTYDFTDEDDVRRVLEALIELGLCRADGKAIWYKCDAYTYMGIESSNSYKIRASLYSSKEILSKEAKAKKDGPIVRLQNKNAMFDGFLQS